MKRKQFGIVSLLLVIVFIPATETRADLDCSGWIADPGKFFYEAGRYRALRDKIRRCLEAGENVNYRDQDGRSPLHHVANFTSLIAYRGGSPIIKILLAAGAEVNARDKRGMTPLHHACSVSVEGSYDDKPNLIEVLISAGADGSARDEQDNTPLHRAVIGCGNEGWEGRTFIAALLDAGADVNARNKEGSTPLLLVAKRADYLHIPHIIQILLGAGAHVDPRDKTTGETPLHILMTQDTPDDVAGFKALLAAGAD